MKFHGYEIFPGRVILKGSTRGGANLPPNQNRVYESLQMCSKLIVQSLLGFSSDKSYKHPFVFGQCFVKAFEFYERRAL